ncbi:MAG: OmpH family outer membrane protein [Candidatus Omnitrophica bacterium]|nr:OmpH family outer membrane protein [Candidatus Omnitrophota bacterium]
MGKFMKKGINGMFFTVLLCLLGSGIFATVCNGAEIQIVSVDTNRVFESHPAFKEAMEKFQIQLQDMKKKIDEAEEGSKEMVQQVMQQQMQQLGMQLQEEAFEKMRADVTKLAKEKKYDYVVDNNVIIVGGKDITEEVLASFEKDKNKESAAPDKKTEK